MVKTCLKGVEVDDTCLQEDYKNLSDEDKDCFCGGILQYSEMSTSVEILCDDQEQERQGHLFFPNAQENLNNFIEEERIWKEGVKNLIDLEAKPEPEAKPETLLQLHPIILIPGDGGSRIQAQLDGDNGPEVCAANTAGIWYDLWVNIEQLTLSVECWKHNMALVYDTITRTTSDNQGVKTRIPGAPPAGTTVDVEWLDPDKESFSAYYAKPVEKLVGIGYQTGVNLHAAPYDFRRAANEQETYFKELKNLIQQTYETNGNTPVVMIAHSMGCPMSLYFLNQQTKDWKEKYIKSLVTLAGPWGGAVKSLEIFAVGTDLGLGTFLDFPIPSGLDTDIKDIIRFIERTQPSLAWMMPSADIWPGDVLIKTESNSVDYTAANLAEFFTLLGVPNMAMMYEDTQKLTSSLVDPGVEVFCLYGTGVPTMEKLVYSGAPQSADPTLNTGDGDGIVNLRSLKGCERWPGVTSKGFSGVTHMGMVTGDEVTLYVANLISGFNQGLVD